MKKQNGPKKFKFDLGHAMFLTVIVCCIAMVCANFNEAFTREKVRVVCESGSFLEAISDQYPWLEIEVVDSIGGIEIVEGATSSDEPLLPGALKSPEFQQSIQQSEIININTASSEQLQELNGIGETKAAAIIAYRTENGGFKSIEEICRVKGIGEATFNKIRDRITI